MFGPKPPIPQTDHNPIIRLHHLKLPPRQLDKLNHITYKTLKRHNDPTMLITHMYHPIRKLFEIYKIYKQLLKTWLVHTIEMEGTELMFLELLFGCLPADVALFEEEEIGLGELDAGEGGEVGMQGLGFYP